MSKTHQIKVERREDEGKGASRRLRRAGKVPAIVYGGTQVPASIQLNHEEVWLAQQNEWFYSSLLDLDLDGQIQKVLLRDLQRHPYKQLILHLDFQRVNENEALSAAVPLHFVGEENSPAGKAADVVVTHELNEVTIECLPKDLPEFIEVDLSALDVDQVVHLSDLKLPAGVSIPQLKLGEEHDLPVAIAKVAEVEAEPEPAPEATGETPAAPAAEGKDEAK